MGADQGKYRVKSEARLRSSGKVGYYQVFNNQQLHPLRDKSIILDCIYCA